MMGPVFLLWVLGSTVSGQLEGAKTATTSTPITGALHGTVLERGSRRPVPYATLTFTPSHPAFPETSDERGEFVVETSTRTLTLEITAPGYEPYRQHENVEPGTQLDVIYLLYPTSRSPYEIVVSGERDRSEVSRTRLRGRDLTEVAGTQGDPFKVIATLPGVAPVVSLLPFPVVRGSSPGNTGYLIDGVRVPLLFHLLAGPSIVHPELIEEIEFYPGAFSVDHGGYTGGIVNGVTARPSEEAGAEVDINLFQAGGLAKRPFLGGNGIVAGRYGYPGLLISAASPRVSLSYWDYQAKWDIRTSSTAQRAGWSVFAFGAFDELSTIPSGLPDTAEKEPALRFQFHRLDLANTHATAALQGQHRISFGYEESLVAEGAELVSLFSQLRSRWRWNLDPSFSWHLGLDGQAKWAEFEEGAEDAGTVGELLGMESEPSSLLFSAGGLTEALWSPVSDLEIRPGMRIDLYSDGLSALWGLDPRFSTRFRVAPELWLEAGVGRYHQPARFTIPIPGLDQLAFQEGLLASTQVTLGASVRVAGVSVEIDGYYNDMDPILYDLTVNPSEVAEEAPEAPPGEAPPTPPKSEDGLDDRLDELLSPAVGRAYGLEVLVRRESRSGVSGWVSYTLSRSERLREGEWVAFDFDRTHLLNAVLSVPLPRRWQLGFRAQVLSGRPLTTTAGLSRARTDVFVRFDLRVDKTVLLESGLLDFYVDITNVTLEGEELSAEESLRYVLPTVGFRGMF